MTGAEPLPLDPYEQAAMLDLIAAPHPAGTCETCDQIRDLANELRKVWVGH